MSSRVKWLGGLFGLATLSALALGPTMPARTQDDAAPPSAAESDSINAERRARIELMYEGYRRDFPDIQHLSATTLLDWMEEQKLVLVDVRRDEEREVSVLAGSISRREYENRREEFARHKVVTYCTIGYRSGRYAEILQKNGINSYNLIGGILAWTHAGGEIQHEGKSTRRVHVYGRQWSLLPVDYEPVW